MTALVLDLPDATGQGAMINCGHPPPLLLRDGQVTVLESTDPAPPLGLGSLGTPGLHSDTFTFAEGDTLLLYTDGVIEARSPEGTFYPLAERAATFPLTGPEELLHHLLQDMTAHTESGSRTTWRSWPSNKPHAARPLHRTLSRSSGEPEDDQSRAGTYRKGTGVSGVVTPGTGGAWWSVAGVFPTVPARLSCTTDTRVSRIPRRVEPPNDGHHRLHTIHRQDQ